MSRQSRNILILAIVGFVFIIVISTLGTINRNDAPVYTLVLYAGLVVVTMLYAYFTMEVANATRNQADASIRMAEEMREQRIAMYKPIIVVRYLDSPRSDSFIKHLQVNLANEGQGTAFNVRVRLEHSLSADEEYRRPQSLVVGDDFVLKLSCRETIESEVPPKSVLKVVAHYNDISGNAWHSVFDFHWDSVNKSVTSGSPKAGLAGSYRGT